MLKKIFSLTLIGLLITNVLIPLETFANENSLSYEQIIEKLGIRSFEWETPFI
ncbi:hypothetical protein NSQ82_17585 [Caldifermentibacillus hisashii]|uniref:hypothetical protein n=1 Tax=Caldifermentibacillus hisashii TaxID=996558 RepID=UPI0031B6B7B7